MSGASIRVDGANEVSLRLQQVTPRVLRALHGTVQRQVLGLLRMVKWKLSGSVLKNRTGHLRASATSDVTDVPNGVLGRVGIYRAPAAVYGRFWEYGFTGEEHVKAHLRGPAKRVAARAERFAKRADAAGHNGDFYRQAAGGGTLVKAHTRHVNQAPRSYLRTTLAEFRDAILAGMREAVAKALGSAS